MFVVGANETRELLLLSCGGSREKCCIEDMGSGSSSGVVTFDCSFCSSGSTLVCADVVNSEGYKCESVCDCVCDASVELGVVCVAEER